MLHAKSPEGYVPLYGAAPPLALILSDDVQVHQKISETLNGHGFKAQCATYLQFPSVLEQLGCRPKLLIVDTLADADALQMIAEMVESDGRLKGCARLGLGDGDKRNNVSLHLHHRWRFPCESVEILRLATHMMRYHAADEPTPEDARIVL
ncbi:MAG: hypothetical protein NZT92_05955 [Abditibacteriales bacterium]|nr:hypothetical protein [Abditibacteriales bacterium]MDW8365712.1 hypothetical protein [Abditibacteriales bacterium]